MPIIIDANRSGDFSKPVNEHAGELLQRIAEKKMRVAIGGRLTRELFKTRLRNMLIEWERAGRVRRYSDGAVDVEEKMFSHKNIRSDDPHILALASVSGSRLLFTCDRELIADFKNVLFLSPKGKVVKPTTDRRIARYLFQALGT